jgi:hypothetical protein
MGEFIPRAVPAAYNVIVGTATDAQSNANHCFDRSTRRSNESKTTIRPWQNLPTWKYENRCSKIQLVRYRAKLRTRNNQAVQTEGRYVTKQVTNLSPMTTVILWTAA